MNSSLRLWKENKLTKIILSTLRSRRDNLLAEMIQDGVVENRFRIQELDNLLDDELLEKLLEEEIIDEI